MRKHILKKSITGFLTALLVLSMPLQSFGATMTGMRASSAYTNQTGQGAQADYASSAEVLKQLREIPAFDAGFYADTYPDALSAFGRNAAALETHYRTIGIYEGRMANAGDLSAWKLRNMRRIRRFLDANTAYYLAHFLDADFPWFHADTYLQKYPEVREMIRKEYEAAGAVPTEEQYREGAVKHYLDRGALEGKSSCSAFDPVWALVADPDIADPAKPDLTPADVRTAYQARSGKTGTQDLTVGIPEGILQLVTAVAGSSSGSTAGKPGSGGGGGGRSSGGGGGGGKSGPDEETHPDHTFLMYLCGSDLETKYTEGTGALMRMMYGFSQTSQNQAERMKVLICAGGSAGWNNSYFYSYLNEQNHNTAVYTLNYEEIGKRFHELQAGTADLPIPSEKQKQLLMPYPDYPDCPLSVFNCWNTLGKEWPALADYLINADTVPLYKEQLTTGSQSISDAPVLNSFLGIGKKTQAKQYSLFFWDHGGGLPGGVCQDDSPGKGKTLYFEEIRSSLEKQDLKCGLIGFDACLMSSTEGAYYLKDWCDYIVASEEISTGDYAYEELLKYIGGHLGDSSLAKDTAMLAAEYKYIQYPGAIDLPATSAVIETGKAESAAAELNQLSKDLYEFAENKDLPEDVRKERRNLVYNSILQARLRSLLLGHDVESGRYGNDFVDAGNFLDRLKAELTLCRENAADAETAAFLAGILDENNGSLQKTIKAVDDLTLANYLAWNNNFYFVNGLPETDEKGNDTLRNIRTNIWLNGTSLYIPYFHNYSLQSYRDPKMNPWDSRFSLLFGDSSYYRKLIDAYTDEFISLLPSEENGLHGEEEARRISNLKKELTAGRKLQLDKDGNPLKDKDGCDLYVEGDEGRVPGYADILDINWKKEPAAGKNKNETILQVTINSDAYDKMKPSVNSTSDPFLDLLDTMDAMKAFVTRRVEGLWTDSDSGKVSSITLDLVIGETDVAYNSIDGVDSAINIFYSTLENAVSTRVNGGNADGSKYYTQYVIPYHEVEDFAGDKERALNALLGVDDKRNAGDYAVLRGSVILKEGTASPEDVCLIFGKDEIGNTVYLGAVERYEQTGNDKEAFGFRSISGTVTDVSFSHMVIDKDSSGMPTVMYADGKYNLDSILVPYSVSNGNRIYLVTDTSDAAQLPGNKEQNSYYFALAPANGLTDTYVLDVRVPDSDIANETGEIIKELPTDSIATDLEAQQTQQAAAAAARSAETVQEPENNTSVTVENVGDVTAETTVSDGEGGNTDTTISEDEGNSDDTSVSEGGDSSDDTTVSEGDGSSGDTTVSEGDESSDDTTVSEGDGSSDDTAVSEGDGSSGDTTVSEGDGSSDDAAVSEGDGSSDDAAVSEGDESSDDTTVSEGDGGSDDTAVSEGDESSDPAGSEGDGSSDPAGSGGDDESDPNASEDGDTAEAA